MEESLASLLNRGYCGFLGVDMMICLEDGRYLLHPCVEINLRMNMGVVSHTIFNRYVHCLSHGKYIVKYYSEDGEAWDAFCQMKALINCIYAMVNSLKDIKITRTSYY